jgi:hypothetical protein
VICLAVPGDKTDVLVVCALKHPLDEHYKFRNTNQVNVCTCHGVTSS